jgi:hypothetical protein
MRGVSCGGPRTGLRALGRSRALRESYRLLACAQSDFNGGLKSEAQMPRPADKSACGASIEHLDILATHLK